MESLSHQHYKLCSDWVHERYPYYSPLRHFRSTRRHSHDEWNKAFPVFRALPFHIYTECKLKNIKQGRPGNEAHHDTRVHLFTSSSIYTCRLSPTPATCDPSTPVFEIPLCTYTAEQIISILLEPIDESFEEVQHLWQSPGRNRTLFHCAFLNVVTRWKCTTE